jgi:hypothetical protein
MLGTHKQLLGHLAVQGWDLVFLVVWAVETPALSCSVCWWLLARVDILQVPLLFLVDAITRPFNCVWVM